jgi:hypothetical protein
MGLRDRLKRLRRASEEDVIVIPQKDGTVKRFPKEAAYDAFMDNMARLRASHQGADLASLPPEHPLTTAAINSSDPTWRGSFFAVHADPVRDVPDLSE